MDAGERLLVAGMHRSAHLGKCNICSRTWTDEYIEMCGPTDVEGEVRNYGFYDPIPYRYYSYPKSARNIHENRGEGPDFRKRPNSVRLKIRRPEPRYLCFPRVRTDHNLRGRLTPKEWRASHGSGRTPTYIFVSYTGEKQFGRLCDRNTEQFVCNCKC